MGTLNRAIELNPHFGLAWGAKGNGLAAQGKYDEAILAYNKAIELNQEDPGLWINKGDAFYRQGKYNEALNAYDKAIEIIPFAEYSYSRGIALRALGRTTEADAAFAKAQGAGV